MGQVSFDRFEMTVHRGKGSLLVTLPFLLCRREHIHARDIIVFDKPERKNPYKYYKFYKKK